MDWETFCRNLPKIELHAHLNGSLSRKTLKKLYKLQNPEKEDDNFSLELDECSSLSNFFEMFDLTYSLTNTAQAIYIAAKDVIEEFCNDNVIYLEIRSTPRATETLMTKREYAEAVIRAIKDSEMEGLNITVKFLISVNRKQGKNAAKENMELAIELHQEYPNYVVGIDLSGDPTQGDAFIKLMTRCKQAGLKISAHCGEVANKNEVLDILSFKPDRLGHCTCLHPALNGCEEQFSKLLESGIPVELCLTSNIKCKTVPSLSEHHFQYLYKAKHPVCIATDDKGVFNTTLSEEFDLLRKNFNLSKEQLRDFSRESVKYTFATGEEKNKLFFQIDNFQL